MKKKSIILLLSLTTLCSCFKSWMKSPTITGTIVDHNTGLPIDNCKVGNTTTNAEGHFKIKEKRRTQFPYIPLQEAPPASANEVIIKEGYLSDTIKYFNRFGGAQKKGTVYNVDTIYLKKVN